jgi:hypothetical protein
MYSNEGLKLADNVASIEINLLAEHADPGEGPECSVEFDVAAYKAGELPELTLKRQ